MKGVVLAEFHEFIEARFGSDMLSSLIETSEPMTHSSDEDSDRVRFLQLANALIGRMGVPFDGTMREFGRVLFGRFAVAFPAIIRDARSSLEFLEKIDGPTAEESRLLYGDDDWPSFELKRVGESTYTLRYESHFPLASLVRGLIEGCIVYFDDDIHVAQTMMRQDDGCSALFTLNVNSCANVGRR